MGTAVKNEVKKPSKLAGKKTTKKLVVASDDSTLADRKYDEIMDKVGKPEYSGRVYEKETIIPIQAPLFVDFLNLNHESAVNLRTMRQGLSATKQNIENLLTVIDSMLLSQDIMTAKFAEQHIDNVDAGLTRGATEADLQVEESEA